MKDLELGDAILAENNEYQPIYAFGHSLDNRIPAEFLVFHTNETSQQPLEITPYHMLYTYNNQSIPVVAEAIQVGDVLVHRNQAGKTVPAMVTRIEGIMKSGVFLPLTPDSTLVVNGMKASAFASVPHAEELLSWLAPVISPQTIFHWWLAPLRMVCTSTLFPRGASACHSYTNDGLLVWLDMGNELARYLNECHFLIHSPSVVFVLFLLGCIRFVEMLFGPTLGWLVLCATAALLWTYLAFRTKRCKHSGLLGKAR